MRPFISPNFHPLLVHYPIALLISGVLIELFSFLGWRDSSFRTAGRWMILLGAMSGIPTALSGIYALNDVAHIGVPETDSDAPWRQVAAESPLVHDAAAWGLMVRHTWLASIATGLLVLTVVTWIACSDTWRDRLHFPFLILLLAGVGLTAAAAWHSGEGVYRHAVGVQKSEAAGASTQSSSAPAEARNTKQLIEAYVQPEQAHVIGAGIAVALAMVALGLSIRAMTSMTPAGNIDNIAEALGGNSGEHLDEPGPPAPPLQSWSVPEHLVTRMPVARFWLLAALMGLLTAVGGWYLLACTGDTILPFKDLWTLIRDPAQNSGFWFTRRLGHVVCGVTIIVVSIVLAGVARWAPRSKVLLGLLTLLLLVAIAGQVWLGTMLIFDGNAGPVMGFAR